ncbi:putative D-amino-acid oxidase [[Candida] railenensis]|uniref:D-amino-acid oxidase n=1 Tax=[Candida] railenensis TaxID=45579 RepID=A0A9P0QV76_9ASCO|nr:putative D-amino-acid oxidase [[Candida] railenensis]
MKQDIVVVGAGVIGLTNAVLICEQHKDVNVTVIARYFPDDSLHEPEYTSAWAGAHFRPFPSKNEAEQKEYPLTRLTQKHFRKLAVSNPESSVTFVTGEDFLEDPPQNYLDLPKSYVEDMEDFEIVHDKNELASKRAAFGARYKTWVVNPPIYLNYLLNKLNVEHGVKFMRANLTSLKQVYSIPEISSSSILINCTGQGLQYNGGYDPLSFPIRGQTLLVRPPLPVKAGPYFSKTTTHQGKDGNWTFCINRPFHGGVIVGGTKQPNDFYNKPRQSDTDAVLKRAEKIFPELMKTDEVTGKKYFDVFKTNVGFRPARNGGVRIELENVDGGRRILHAYGLAGSGYELSYGVATEVDALLKSLIRESNL